MTTPQPERSRSPYFDAARLRRRHAQNYTEGLSGFCPKCRAPILYAYRDVWVALSEEESAKYKFSNQYEWYKSNPVCESCGEKVVVVYMESSDVTVLTGGTAIKTNTSGWRRFDFQGEDIYYKVVNGSYILLSRMEAGQLGVPVAPKEDLSRGSLAKEYASMFETKVKEWQRGYTNTRVNVRTSTLHREIRLDEDRPTKPIRKTASTQAAVAVPTPKLTGLALPAGAGDLGALISKEAKRLSTDASTAKSRGDKIRDVRKRHVDRHTSKTKKRSDIISTMRERHVRNAKKDD